MPTHKDLLQAHRLMTQRSALALITGEPDSPHQPLRRLNTGMVSSLLVGAIAAAVFAVLGLIAPASASDLTKAGTLVIDAGSATAYVPCDHGRLCPALNYPSALLALVAAAAIVAGTGIWLPRYRPSPFWSRAADITETVAIISLVPLALGVAGIFGLLRGLG